MKYCWPSSAPAYAQITAPKPTPTATPEPTHTPEPQPPTATPPLPAIEEEPGWLIGLSELRSLLGVLTGLLTVAFVAIVANRRMPTGSLTQRLGRFLWGITGGLLLYNYYALGMPGSAMFSIMGGLTGLILILLGGLIGIMLYRPTRHV